MSNVPRYRPPVFTRSGTWNTSFMRRLINGWPSAAPMSMSPLVLGSRLHANDVLRSMRLPDEPTVLAVTLTLDQWFPRRVTTPDAPSMLAALSVSVVNDTSPGTSGWPASSNRAVSWRSFSSVTETFVTARPASLPPRSARLPLRTARPCFTATVVMRSTYTFVLDTVITNASVDVSPANEPMTRALPCPLGTTIGPVTRTTVLAVDKNTAEFDGNTRLCPFVNCIVKCSLACSYLTGEEPPIGESVAASTTCEPGYSGYGVALTTSLLMAASWTGISATTPSC